jgi:hypothetical protein
LRRSRPLEERLRSAGIPLLTPRTFDAWLTRSGAVALRRAGAQLPLPFLFGQARARRLLYTEICRALDSDPRIRTALATSFEAIPRVIADVAAAAHSAQLLSLVHREASRRLVAVPRAAVVRRLAREALGTLGPLPTLSPYEGLAAFLVGSLSVEAELGFVEALRRDLPAACGRAGAMIAAVDRDSAWGLASPGGHYWIAETSMSSLDLNREPDRRRFAGTVERSLAQARGDLSDLEVSQRASVLARLMEVLSGRGAETARPRRRSPSGAAQAPAAVSPAKTTVLASAPQVLRSDPGPDAGRPADR